jgi:23S rRNA pseudouridine1911/1915/1917 synthase
MSLSQNADGVRLDKYLTEKFPQYSRAFLKSQILAGNILINNKIKKPSYILKETDEIKINIIAPEKHKLQANPDIKLKIIYEDKNIIAIDKPAGISVHPATAGQNDTIANAILAYCPAIKDVGDEPNLRPGIVHRLDKETSGILVIAKNKETFDWLKKQFAERKIIKRYTALALGKFKEKQGVISKPIGRAKDFRKRTTTTIKEQKEAVTYYKNLKHYSSSSTPLRPNGHLAAPVGVESLRASEGRKIREYSLVEAEPKTGRTHQIRVHFASLGHPLAGDKLYGFKNQIAIPSLKRHFLHASYLKFSLLDGKMIELKSELPKDLEDVLANLNTK